MASTRSLYRSVKLDRGWLPPPNMVCPLCEATTRINADGSLRRHRMPPNPDRPYWAPLISGPVCPMSNH